MLAPESREDHQQNIITQPTNTNTKTDQLAYPTLEANLIQLFSNSKWTNKTRRRNPLKHHSEDSDNESNFTNPANNNNKQSPWYPVERWGHSTFVIEKYMYLIGGYIEDTYPISTRIQLYRLDCETFEWERINSEAADGVIPDHRDSHMMCVVQDTAYMFGGKKDDEVMLDDLWKMTVSSVNSQKGVGMVNWSKIEATGNVPSTRESAQLCSVNNRYILLFGGTNGKDEEENFVVYDDMYVMDTQTNEWREIVDKKGANIAARDSFGMVEVNGYVYIFGGQGSSVGSEDVFYNDLYRLKLEVNSDGQSYSVDIEELFPNASDLISASAKRPCGRSSNSTCVVKDRYIFIIGGEKGEEMKLDDVWVYDTQENIWAMLQQQKKSRHSYLKPLISHSSSVYQDNIIVFGGMYKDENQHSDQTLLLSLNMSADHSQEIIRKSQNSVASLQSEDQQNNNKYKINDGQLKSGIIEDDNNLLTNQHEERENKIIKGKTEKMVSPKETQESLKEQQINHSQNEGIERIKNNNNNEDLSSNKEIEEPIEEQEQEEEDQNRVIAVGTAGSEGVHVEEEEQKMSAERVEDQSQVEQQKSLEGEQSLGEQEVQQKQQQSDNMEIEETSVTKEEVEKNQPREEDKIEVELDNNNKGKIDESRNNEDNTQEGNTQKETLNDQSTKIQKEQRNDDSNDVVTSNSNLNNNNNNTINNANTSVATTVTILKHQQQQHQQHHHIPPVISEEHILHIRQPYVSMSFLSSIGSLIPSPITALGMLAHNAKSQFASTFQINLMQTPKKDTYMNTFVMNKTTDKSTPSSNSSPMITNTFSKVNGQLLNKSIDKELIEQSHLYLQIFDDSEGFTPQDFIEILYKFDYYQAINYNKSHKELVQDEQGLQAKTQYGTNLKLASLRIGQNVLFISKNKAYNILNVGLISSNGKINPSLQECIMFLFSIDMKRKVYLTENGDQNKRIILNNIAFLMSEEQLFKHDRGTYIYIFDLKRVPQAGIDGYEFQYSPGRRDIVEKKRCFFGDKKDQVERLIDYSLRSSFQHLYSKPPENFHFAVNTCRYEFIAYSDILRKQKGMRLLKELNTENIQLLKDIGKVSIYEQINYNSNNNSNGSSDMQAEGQGVTAIGQVDKTSPRQAGRHEKDEKDSIITEQQIAQSNEQPKVEGTTTRKNTSVEFHQGILIYADERLIGRVESHQFGNAFIDKILNKTKGQQNLFKYVGIIELDKYFTPNIFNTGIQNSYEDSQIRSRIKVFLKQQQKQQYQPSQQSLQALTTSTSTTTPTTSKSNNPLSSNISNVESKDRNELPRKQSIDGSSEEPELRKEIKID